MSDFDPDESLDINHLERALRHHPDGPQKLEFPDTGAFMPAMSRIALVPLRIPELRFYSTLCYLTSAPRR